MNEIREFCVQNYTADFTIPKKYGSRKKCCDVLVTPAKNFCHSNIHIAAMIAAEGGLDLYSRCSMDHLSAAIKRPIQTRRSNFFHQWKIHPGKKLDIPQSSNRSTHHTLLWRTSDFWKQFHIISWNYVITYPVLTQPYKDVCDFGCHHLWPITRSKQGS